MGSSEIHDSRSARALGASPQPHQQTGGGGGGAAAWLAAARLFLPASLIEGKPAVLLLCCDESRVRCSTIGELVRGPGGKGIDQNPPPLPILELRVFSLDRMLCVL